MTRQVSKRNRPKGGSYLPPFARLDYGGPARTGWIYREVDDLSAKILKNTTNHIRSRGSRHVPEKLSFTLVYPEMLAKERERSRLKNPPSMSTLAAKLGELELSTMLEPTSATVIGVSPVKGALGVVIDYPGLTEELTLLNRTASEELGFSRPSKVTPGIAHISILRGLAVRSSQILQIKSALPSSIELSAVKQPEQGIIF
jgi:hypothetical protein